MPAEQSLASLADIFTNNPDTNVLLVSHPHDDACIQRLNLDDALSADFRTVARDAYPGNINNIRLRPYDPGYKPDSDELLYIDLSLDDELSNRIREFASVQRAELFREDDEIIDTLKFYAIVVSPSARRHAIFFRSYSPKKELTRKGCFAAVLGRGHYNKVETKIFLFDYKVDCFAWNGYLFILNVAAFQRIFNYFEELRAHAEATLDQILASVPVRNAQEFRNACTKQIQMISKLAQIARKPYLTSVTMNDIRRTIQEFNLDVTIEHVGNQEQIVFEQTPSKRWLILKLLDDDYLGSVMTRLKYEVNSKSVL